MQMSRQRRLRVLTVAAPTPGSPSSQAGPLGYSPAPFCSLIRLSVAEWVAWWRWGGFCREGGVSLLLQQMSLDCILLGSL